MNFDERYFIISIHFNFAYKFTLQEEPNGTFIDLNTSTKYRKRLLYDCGWGQEEGYEMLPPLSFSNLIALIECYSPLKQEKFLKKHSAEETEKSNSRLYNLLGAVSVIMQDHIEELIDFLSIKINTDYFINSNIRENYKWFAFSTEKTWEIGKIPGGILTQSFEDVFNEHPKWGESLQRLLNWSTNDMSSSPTF